MPSKIQLDVNLWFLYICLQKSDYKTIDFHAVGEVAGLNAPAARMRFTRLKKQIENGGFNASTRTTPQLTVAGEKTKNSKARKKTKANHEKTENNTGADSKNGLNFHASQEEPGKNRMMTRPRNMTIKMEDSCDYRIPPEVDKNEKYESEGSLYVVEDADIESDDDIPLAKRRKMAWVSSAPKRNQQVTDKAANGDVQQQAIPPNFEKQDLGQSSRVKVEGMSKRENQTGKTGPQVPVTAVTLVPDIPIRDISERPQLQTWKRGNEELNSASQKDGMVHGAYTGILSCAASSVTPTVVFPREQNNDGRIAYPSWGPLPSSFRSLRTDSRNQGLPESYSSTRADVERDSLNALTAPKPQVSRPDIPIAHFKREGFMSWRETAARARALRRPWPISKPKEIDLHSTVRLPIKIGSKEVQVEQLPIGEHAESLTPQRPFQPWIPQVVIDLEEEP